MAGPLLPPVAAALATAVLALLSGMASGRFIVEKSRIKVLTPVSARGEFDAAIANFGIPQYGGTLTGVVMYSDQMSTGCTPFDKTFKSQSSRPVLLIVDRGDCYFALKTWNAQAAGAAAVLVADNVEEPLLTMDTPEETSDTAYLDNITIPSVLITLGLGNSLKSAVAAANSSGEVVARLDWTESMPHPDERVEYELWTNSNDECGARCDEQMAFVSGFKGHAQLLERGGFTLFTPHYITWYCPESFVDTEQCKSQCINKGRYCAPDPEEDFGAGYEGKDIVVENLRQLCVHRVANASGRPWVWWDFVTDYHIRCSMKAKNYTHQCAEDIVTALGLSTADVSKCMGDPNADTENAVLKAEQTAQVGHGSRGDVTILPTLVINDIQYRGKLESSAVLKAICAGFKESTEPHVCLTPGLETNECLDNNGGCWKDPKLNISACKDTYRGKVCECPLVNGVQYRGDGYTGCQAVGPGRCSANNGGCWKESRDGQTFSACSDANANGCACPAGFRGDGYKCENINECAEGAVCSCKECTCTDSWGGYDCKCRGNYAYLKDEDTCIPKSTSKVALIVTLVVLAIVVAAAIAGYIFYKYRLRSYMDSEIMAIMSQYVRLDDDRNQQIHTLHEEVDEEP